MTEKVSYWLSFKNTNSAGASNMSNGSAFQTFVQQFLFFKNQTDAGILYLLQFI